MRDMLRDGTAPARGPRYHAASVRNDPPPIQPRLPILIGGDGEKKTLATVARYADTWNTGGDIEFVRHKDEVLRRWCEDVGRDEAEIERTLGLGLVIIRDDPAEARRIDAVFREQHPGFSEAPKVGSADQIAESLSRSSGSGSATSSSMPRRRSTTRRSSAVRRRGQAAARAGEHRGARDDRVARERHMAAGARSRAGH